MKLSIAVALAGCFACVVTAEPPKGVGQPRPTGQQQGAAVPPPAVGEPKPRLPPTDRRATDRPREPRVELPPAVAGEEPSIELLDRGGPDATSLRISAPAGAEQRLTVTVSGTMSFTADDEVLTTGAFAALEATWLAKVASVGTDGSRTIDLTIEAVRHDEIRSDPSRGEAARRAIAMLEGVRAQVVVGPSGAPGKITMNLQERTADDARPAVEAALQVVPLLFVAAPGEGVGSGASWKASSLVDFAALELQQTAEYRVTKTDDDGSTIAVDFGHAQPGRAAPRVERRILAVQGSGKGELTLAAGQIVPARIEAKVHTEMHSSLRLSGKMTPAKLTLDVDIVGVPAR